MANLPDKTTNPVTFGDFNVAYQEINAINGRLGATLDWNARVALVEARRPVYFNDVSGADIAMSATGWTELLNLGTVNWQANGGFLFVFRMHLQQHAADPLLRTLLQFGPTGVPPAANDYTGDPVLSHGMANNDQWIFGQMIETHTSAGSGQKSLFGRVCRWNSATGAVASTYYKASERKCQGVIFTF